MRSLKSANGPTGEYSFAARVAYALATLLLVLPLADITLGFFPLQFDNLRWRVGVTGMTTGALLLPITGLFLALVTAHVQDHRRVQLVLTALTAIGALLLFAAAAMFALDTIQLRGDIPQAGRHLYDRAAGKGVLSQLLTAAVLLFVAISSFRAVQAAARLARERQPEVKVGPIMGRPGTPTSA